MEIDTVNKENSPKHTVFSKIANAMPYMFSLMDTYSEYFLLNESSTNMFTVSYSDNYRINNDNLSRSEWRKFRVGTEVSEFTRKVGGGTWKIDELPPGESMEKDDQKAVLNNMYGLADYSWLSTKKIWSSTSLYSCAKNFLMSRVFPYNDNSTSFSDDYGLKSDGMTVFEFIDFGNNVFEITGIMEGQKSVDSKITFMCTSRKIDNKTTYGTSDKRRLVAFSMKGISSMTNDVHFGVIGTSVVQVPKDYVGPYLYSRLNLPKFALSLTLYRCGKILETFRDNDMLGYYDKDGEHYFYFANAYKY